MAMDKNLSFAFAYKETGSRVTVAVLLCERAATPPAVRCTLRITQRMDNFASAYTLCPCSEAPFYPTGSHDARASRASAASIRARMSRARQQVVRSPSLTGLGNRPFLTPFHQVDLLTGTSRNTCGKRKSAEASI